MTQSNEHIGDVTFRWRIRNRAFEGELLHPDRLVLNHVLGHINDKFLLVFDGRPKTITIGSMELSTRGPVTQVPFIGE